MIAALVILSLLVGGLLSAFVAACAWMHLSHQVTQRMIAELRVQVEYHRAAICRMNPALDRIGRTLDLHGEAHNRLVDVVHNGLAKLPPPLSEGEEWRNGQRPDGSQTEE